MSIDLTSAMKMLHNCLNLGNGLLDRFVALDLRPYFHYVLVLMNLSSVDSFKVLLEQSNFDFQLSLLWLNVL